MTMRLVLLLLLGCQMLFAQQVHIRANIVGYLPEDAKVALIMSDQPIQQKAALYDANTGEVVFKAKAEEANGRKWGKFNR